jgi:hypothetical protein
MISEMPVAHYDYVKILKIKATRGGLAPQNLMGFFFKKKVTK